MNEVGEEMNPYVQATFNQISVSIRSISELLDELESGDLDAQPTENKLSIGQLFAHMALVCKADLLIANEASEEEMSDFYASNHFTAIEDIKEALLSNFSLLKTRYMNYTEDELMQRTTSYWGVSYTRFEWLLEISSHLYHHRGQLHAMLVHCLERDPKVPLFE